MGIIKKTSQAFQQPDDRLQSLLELLSDWYWEQDERYCFTLLTGQGLKTSGIDPRPFLGTTRWDHGRIPPGANDNWDSHKAALKDRQPFTDFIYKIVTQNNELRYMSASGAPVFDGTGKFRGYHGIGKDVTRQVQLEMRRSIEHAVTRILATSGNCLDAIPKIIEVICKILGWACGARWTLDAPGNMMHCAETWSIATPAIEAFAQYGKQSLRLEKNPLGLVRAAWAKGEPVWVPDVAKDTTFLRAAEAAKAGLHSAFAFPIKNGAQVIGVMELFSSEIHRPDADLLDCVTYVGDQISQFSQLMQAREKLLQSEERFRSLTELSSDYLWEQDEKFRMTFVDGAFEEKTGLSAAAYVGKTRWDLPALNLAEEDWAYHKQQLERHEPFHDFEMQLPDFQGRACWVSISGRPIFDAEGNFQGYRGVGKDIAARKLNEERIRYLATHDGLTSLPNRFLFNEILTNAIQAARRYNRKFALMFIDLDRFKLINDTLGHDAGDTMLMEMSIRLAQCLRASDVVARLGGDEFVMLIHHVEEENYVAKVAAKILSAITRPIMLREQECRMTASIGICLYPANAQDEQSLMNNADVAMYRAKAEGRDNFQFYSEDLKSQSQERLALETSLRRAVERDQFFLHYQPKLDLGTNNITGVEALLRWQHPDLGVISPLRFIPLAEETGLIVPIGKWVLHTACAQNVAWQRGGFPPLCMSVNLSARQFADEFLLDDIAAALRESGMAPALLELELTESMMIQNPERAARLLIAIKAMGVRLAIDDFGTGYSSLAQLKNFPIDTLKVDRSFIRDIPHDAEDEAMTRAIISMGKTLGLTVVAEGVETQEQETFLRDHGCDEIQGFYFSRPLAPDRFAELWRRHAEVKRDLRTTSAEL